MIKTVLIKLAFNLVVEFICHKAEAEGKDWKDDFCDFAKKIRDSI